MKAIDYTHLFWACGVMHIDPCNGLMLAKLAHGVTATAHQFSVQVEHTAGMSSMRRSLRGYFLCSSWGAVTPLLMPARLAPQDGLPTVCQDVRKVRTS